MKAQTILVVSLALFGSSYGQCGCGLGGLSGLGLAGLNPGLSFGLPSLNLGLPLGLPALNPLAYNSALNYNQQALNYALPPPPAAGCLPLPNPSEALAAALAVPGPALPPPQLPVQAPTGPILDGCGPAPSPLPVIQAPSVSVQGPDSPVIPLPTPPLPAPQVIAHKCTVSKVVQKPQIYQRLVQVPTVARFLKNSFAPVVENIAYVATPQCGQSGCGCGSYALPPPPPCGCGC